MKPINMNEIIAGKMIEDVRDFMTRSGQNITFEQQEALIVEEALEVLEAYADFEDQPGPETAVALLKEIADFFYVMCGAAVIQEAAPEAQHQISPKVMSLLIAVAAVFSDVSVFIPMPVLTEAIARVHASNMTKLVDGKGILNENNKVLKGPNYVPADLSDLEVPMREAFADHLIKRGLIAA